MFPIVTNHILTGLILLVRCFMMTSFHAIHVSYGEASINGARLTAKITFNKPDFMDALQTLHGSPLVNFSNPDYDKLKDEYLRRNIIIRANTVPCGIFITGNNEDNSSIWFNIKFELPPDGSTLTLRNTVLCEKFSDQMNLLNLTTPKKEENFIFTCSTPEHSIVLQ